MKRHSRPGRRALLLTVALTSLAVAALGPVGLVGEAAADEPRAGAAADPNAAPVTVGWWTSAQIAGAPVGLATLVPDGGLQVANGSGGPVSIAAVRFAVPAASDATLVLHLAPGSTPETASVVACPVTARWEPIRGAPLTAAPTWNCDLGTASAAYDPVARTLQWSLDAALVRDGSLDVMLLPVEAGLPFNVTAEAPGADAVRTAAHPPGGSSDSDPPSSSPSRPDADAPPPESYGSGGPQLSFSPVDDGPFDPAPPAIAPVGLPSPLPKAPPAPAAVADDLPPGGGHWVGIVLLVVALGAGLALWRGWPTLPGAHPSTETRRGIGRFARPRTDLPARI